MAGYFGKLPLRGDFIQRNVSSDFVNVWDGWLQTVIANSRDNLGSQWLEYYLVSPIWRFLVPINQQHYYAGVMLPSVDKVGRYFPFTLCSPLVPESSPLTLIQENLAWFDQAESLALQALDESINFEQLNTNIDNMLGLITNLSAFSKYQVNSFRVPLSSESTLSMALNKAGQQQQPLAGDYKTGYWWNSGTHETDGNFISCQMLPDDNIYTAMLDGQWTLCHIPVITDGMN